MAMPVEASNAIECMHLLTPTTMCGHGADGDKEMFR